MKDPSCLAFVLPGAGGGDTNPALFCSSAEDSTCFPTIRYPGWQRYVEPGFSAETLVEDLVAQIAARAPRGPVRIIGVSLGGHLGYGVALNLQASGREIGGFCAIDPFVTKSAAATAGWKVRVLKYGARLLQKRRLDEFGRFLRSRFSRALLRSTRSRLASMIRRIAPAGRLPAILRADPIFEEELSMRLLIQKVAPWLPSLDREPIALKAPAVLLRTTSTQDSDSVWRRRCPQIEIVEIAGDHDTMLDQDNADSFREAFISATREWC